MTDVLETGLLFTFDEIRILLYGIGIRQVEGIYMEEKVLTEAEIIPALHQLSRRGLITVGESAFVIRADVRGMIGIMGNPERTFVWGPQKENCPQFFCYAVPGSVVVSEHYWKKKNTLKLRCFTTEAFERWKEQIEDDYSGY